MREFELEYFRIWAESHERAERAGWKGGGVESHRGSFLSQYVHSERVTLLSTVINADHTIGTINSIGLNIILRTVLGFF